MIEHKYPKKPIVEEFTLIDGKPAKVFKEYIDWDKTLNLKCKPTNRGVYAFLFKEEVVYVGVTSYGIKKRVKKHFTNTKYPSFYDFLSENYQYIEIIQLDNRCSFSLEMYYINYYKPKFNRNYYE